MPLRRAKPVMWPVKGVSDSVDGTTAFPGAMQALTNLVPAPSSTGVWIPRPAAVLQTSFPGFTSPGKVNVLLVVGNVAYGMIAESTGTFAGKDVPFAYNIPTNTFYTISGITAASLPNTPSPTGDWTPPTMAIIGSRVMVTHPGFSGTTRVVGWLDLSGFTSSTVTGSTHGTVNVDTLSTNVLQAGWLPGMTIASSAGDIPGGTTIVSIAADGLSLVLSQAATGSNSGTLTVTGGSATAPQWASGQTNGQTLKGVPVAVFNFNGRAYYGVPGAGMQFSDSGNPTQITNANQALTPQNGLDITAFGGLPYAQSAGGILQALVAFQGQEQIQIVTGDPATMDLAMNALGVSVGTAAPNTIAETPKGLAFIAQDGLRFIDFLGQLSPPVGAHGQGVNVPFLSAVNPTRMAGTYAQDTYRVSVTNGALQSQPTVEYWYDFSLKTWSGPHTFPSALIVSYPEPPNVIAGHGFLQCPVGVTGSLWKSAVNPTLSDGYVENGVTLTWQWQTVLLPDNTQMAENAIVESAVAIALPLNQTINVIALDEVGRSLNAVVVTGEAPLGSLWGGFNWGQAVWGGGAFGYEQLRIPWTIPLVFKQMSVRMTGTSAANVAIGPFYMHYQILGYMLQRIP